MCFSRSQNSFQVTASGPPSSRIRPVAASRSIAREKYSATASAQIGWIRRRTPGLAAPALAALAHERLNVLAGSTQRVHDVASHEAGSPRDEDHRAASF